jgi:hypothetical protein
MHVPRDFNNSVYKKTIKVRQENYDFINAIKGRKSAAGKLDEVITFYRESKHLEKYEANKSLPEVRE